jgi:peptidyl-prolyl cis-trans isomerase SurA
MKLFSFRNIILLFIFFFIPHILHASEKFTVQAGAFSLKNNAQNLVKVLEENHGIKCTMYDKGGLYKIYCGEFSQKAEAYSFKKELSSLGYDAFVVSKIAQASQDPIAVNRSTKQSPYPEVIPPPEVAQASPENSDKKYQEQNPKFITPNAPILLNRVVAVVNKEVITWSELYKAMEFEATTQIKNLSEAERTKIFKESEASFLETLIDMRLQLQEAKSTGLEVTQEEVKETIENIQKKYSMTQTDFIDSLKKEGLNFEDYQKRLSEQILINKVVNYQIRNKIVVSDAEVKRYMEANREAFSGSETYKIRQIFFQKPEGTMDKKPLEEKAMEIIKRLKAGEDFSALARVYSEDPSGRLGGDLGFVNKDIMAKEFVEVLSGMNVGDFSMPFWTVKGLHIIKLDEKVSAQNIDKVKEDVRRQLTEEQFSEKYKSWIKSLREKAYIEVRL